MPKPFLPKLLPAGVVLCGATLLAGCTREQPAPKAPPPPKVTVALPTEEKVVSYREYTGHIEPVETVNVRARVRGFVRKVHFREGTIVKKGAPLYDLDPREYDAAVDQARADVAKAEAELRKAKSEADRAFKIRGTTALSEEDYLARIAARDIAQASLKQSQAAVEVAELNRSFTKIESPIEGRVSRTLATEGNLVGYNEATLLATIVRMDPLYVAFDVPEQFAIEYDRLARAQRASESDAAKLPVQLAVANETGFPHPGEVDFLENRIDPGTGTIRIYGRVGNPKGQLFPGQYARVRVPEGEAREFLTVPQSAVQLDQRGRFVWVVKADNTVENRPVTVGSRASGDRVAILEGLGPDDRVIVNGVQRARAGVQVDPQTAGAAKADAAPPPAKKAGG